MAFHTLRSGPRLLTTLPSGGWQELGREGPRVSDRGWDEATITLAGYFPGQALDSVMLPAEIGNAVAMIGQFFVAGIGPAREWGGYVYLCDIYVRGLREPRGVASQTNANAEMFSGENLEVLVCTPTYEEEYIASYVPTDTVGTAVVAPHVGAAFPAAPLPPWGATPAGTLHVPHGWIHESCVSETLEGTGLHLIRNVYRYQFQYTP